MAYHVFGKTVMVKINIVALALLLTPLTCFSGEADEEAARLADRFFGLLSKNNRVIAEEVQKVVVVGTPATKYRTILERAKSKIQCDIGRILRLHRGDESPPGAPVEKGVQYVFWARGLPGPVNPEGDCTVDVFVDVRTNTVRLVRVNVTGH